MLDNSHIESKNSILRVRRGPPQTKGDSFSSSLRQRGIVAISGGVYSNKRTFVKCARPLLSVPQEGGGVLGGGPGGAPPDGGGPE